MGKKLYEESSIQNIANAIRSKNGSTNTYKVSEMAAAITSLNSSSDLVTFDQIRPEVKNYLDNVTYSPTDYTTSSINDYVTTTSNNYPVGCKINIKQAGRLIIYDTANGGSMTVDSTVGDNYIYNLTPNTVSTYVNIVDNKIVQSGTIKPTGALRMIKSQSAFTFNVRDLGGWTCDGGTVKYGKLFRGGQCYTADRDTFCGLLKINAELNLRYEDEITSYTSPLGGDVEFKHINGVWYGQAKTDNIKEIVSYIIDCINNNKVIYFHCVAGADRTATTAMLIETILGVSQSDMDKDYELTCYYTGVDTDAKARRRNETEWKSLINYFNGYTGETLRDRVINYLVSVGISINDINAFRQNMINGTPAEIVTNKATVTNNLTNATSSNTAVSCDKSSSYTATITASDGYTLDGATVTVTMGGADITSAAYANGVITIGSVTGDIVITIIAKKIVVNLYNKSAVVLNKRHSGSGVADANGRFMTNNISVATGDILNIYSPIAIDYAQGSTYPKSQKIAYYKADGTLLGTRYLFVSGADATAVTTVIDANNTTVKIGYYGGGNVETYANDIAYVIIEIQVNGTNTSITADDVLDLVITKEAEA